MNYGRLAKLMAVAILMSGLWPEQNVFAQLQNQLGVWTDSTDPTLPPGFKLQGEYVGVLESGERFGAQVIALGNGAFQAVLLYGGLPGAGWDGKNKLLLDGQLEGERANFKQASGKKVYRDLAPETFSATFQFPPPGQKDFTAVITLGVLTGKTDLGKEFILKKIDRVSPILGARPPQGAVVLFDGTNSDEWSGARLDQQRSTLNTDGKDIFSKRKFNNYFLHLEFLVPYRPGIRGQARGNSGVFQVDHYEVQILDSFGLDGRSNECGGIYGKTAPSVNTCLPPLVWQTFDIEFTNAVQQDGKKIKNARLTMKHNGVVIHDDLEILDATGGGRMEPEGTWGTIQLQGHSNPVQFRNIWLVEKP